MSGLEREFRLFDIFAHAYYPASAQTPNRPETQLWVWEALPSSGSTQNGSKALSWVPVTGRSYVCPGPGELEGRHLVVQGQGKPTWVLATTFVRHYRVHP